MRILFNYMAMYNYGCEAIVRGTVKILSQVLDDDLEFIMPSHEPDYTLGSLSDIPNFRVVRFSLHRRVQRAVRRKLGINNWYKTTLFDPQVLKSCDCALSVGGDLYTLTCGGDIPWELLGIGENCFDRNIPYVIWGASVGPFEDRPERLPLIVDHLKKTDLILSRDRMTVDYLASKSIKENVRETADPAFWMEPQPCEIGQFLPKIKNVPLLGINFSPLAQRSYPEKSRFISEIVKTCETVIEKFDVSVVLISHVITPFRYEAYDDLQFNKKIYDGISSKFKPHVGIVQEDIGSQRIKYLISQLDYYAGARMHSTIASLSTMVPTISLAYSRKAEALNRVLFGNTEWVLAIPDFTTENFCVKLDRLITNREGVKGALEEKIPILKQRSMKAGEYLRDLLK